MATKINHFSAETKLVSVKAVNTLTQPKEETQK